jgi:hypothetical protein
LLQGIQYLQNSRQDIARSKILDQLTIVTVLSRRHVLFLLIRIRPCGFFQNDFQAFHPADSSKTLILHAIETNIFLIRHAFPGLVMTVIRRYDDTVQIKDHGLAHIVLTVVSIALTRCS